MMLSSIKGTPGNKYECDTHSLSINMFTFDAWLVQIYMSTKITLEVS